MDYHTGNDVQRRDDSTSNVILWITMPVLVSNVIMINNDSSGTVILWATIPVLKCTISGIDVTLPVSTVNRITTTTII